jgi:hypothetical protein
MLTNLFNVSCVAQLVRALAFACAQCVDGTSSTPCRLASTPPPPPVYPSSNPVCVRVVRHRPHIARVARSVRTRCRVPFLHVVCCPRAKSYEPTRHSCVSCVVRTCCACRRVVRASFAHIARAVSRVARCEHAIFNRSIIITHVD